MKNKKILLSVFLVFAVLTLVFLFRNTQAEKVSFKEAIDSSFSEENTYERMAIIASNFDSENEWPGLESVEVDDEELIYTILDSASSMTLIRSENLPSYDYIIELYDHNKNQHVIMIGDRSNSMQIGGMLFDVESNNLLLETLKDKNLVSE